MYKFGSASNKRVLTLDGRLQQILYEAIATAPLDFGIPEYGGKRTVEDQQWLFNEDRSKCDGIDKLSKHQSGLAFDFYPYVNGTHDYDERYCFMLAGHFIGVAKKLGYVLRYGGDWDMDQDFDDQTFNDLVHLELVL